MNIIDLTEGSPEHEAYFVFKDEAKIYFVSEEDYEDFKEAEPHFRDSLADFVVSRDTRQVTKNRYGW